MAHPFAKLARRLGVDEVTVLALLQCLQARGLVSRIGAVFRPNVVGASALAALAVAPERLEAVAAQVSAFSEVNHNYQREHRFNLWFVVTAASTDQLQAVFARIETTCASGAVLVLPFAGAVSYQPGLWPGHFRIALFSPRYGTRQRGGRN